ncbi:beta-lactamase-like protein [Microdochium bolleyi]|uniref:Beta-lactamase-like protein n=1 Tax=Microdochium bolleyi TaxID=196109 RepID=A0A136IUC3_9PEZI|nr:beta-lactamase-like protein [Microdochium bolleyi]
MSTFDGIIREFPGVRIDFFRGLVDQPALVCFLSHVHSDHLAGLDALRSSFVYCSAATREILLRLERYPCRINYAQGILEAREQTYRQQAKLLKPLPLDTPVQIELGPHEHIQATLIDANHCVGAVMFLIENEHNAILYTGDVRAEPWWINSISRNPCLVEYTTGLRTLDRIYLDTSVLDNIHLQSKAEGLRELLAQVARYPSDTLFCMQAWTYGYEEVWTALSKALKSRIHVDKYKMRIYKSLVSKEKSGKFAIQTNLSKEAPSLVGFTCGNRQLPGCLTLDEDVRIHSCEKGTPCATMQHNPVVWIKPIVAHLTDGRDLLEIGVGGGAGDLMKEAELQSLSEDDVAYLLELATEELNIPKELREDLGLVLQKSAGSLRNLAVNMDISSFTDDLHTTMKDALHAMVSKLKDTHEPLVSGSQITTASTDEFDALAEVEHPPRLAELPNQIRFPYARHSSLPELRLLVEAFKPRDVWPCTVDKREWLLRGITMRGLFGDLCADHQSNFEHDQLMASLFDLQCDEDERHLRDDDSVQVPHGHQRHTRHWMKRCHKSLVILLDEVVRGSYQGQVGRESATHRDVQTLMRHVTIIWVYQRLP